MMLKGLRIVLVGPLPPPEGGMANQTLQLARLLESEGAQVSVVRTNAPYWPRWVARVRGLRAVFRLVFYAVALWGACRRADVVHIMANSGWSWHLVASPAIWVARLRGVPSVVNYRGGEAAVFLERSSALVASTLRRASALTVPSAFLHQVFRRHGMHADIVPNIVDTSHFRPSSRQQKNGIPHLVVTRGLEPIYDVGTALRAFALVRGHFPSARLTVAGSGPELPTLRRLARELGVDDSVDFCGRLDRTRMAELYRHATVFVNPSQVDNMPNSVLEAMASGVPVVTTDAGGIPFMVQHRATALIVPRGATSAMAEAIISLLRDGKLAQALRNAALSDVQQYTWARISQRWAAVYASVLSRQIEPA